MRMSALFLYLVTIVIPSTTIDAVTSSLPHTPFHDPGPECSHQPPSIDEINHIHLEGHHVIRKRDTYQPLRIHVHYDESVKNLAEEKFNVINSTILPQALDYWRKALRVKPLAVPIRLNRKCANNKAFFWKQNGQIDQYCVERCELITTCGEVTVPSTHLDVCRSCDPSGSNCGINGIRGDGIEGADFIFYISSTQTDRCNKGATVAYAAHCQQESGMDRPIAGHANLCPDSISTKAQDLETLLSTVKHEILHALGFSVSLYPYFRDRDGNPRIPRHPKSGKPIRTSSDSLSVENVVSNITRRDWKVRSGLIDRTVSMIVTPKVMEEVRNHFNCPDLEGAELEDQGEEGTKLTHWEKRVFENEAMTGTHTQKPVYSRITFALMEDTGWYQPDYDLAQPLKWGKGLGCHFAKKSCKEWIDNKRQRGESIHPYCDKVKKDPLETECTDSREAVALCNLMEYPKELEGRYQNFDSLPGVKNDKEGKRYGGSVNLADYCPYIQEFTWKSNDVVIRGSQCHFVENNPNPEKNFALETYGPSSRCFNHNHQMWEEKTCTQVRQWQHWGSGCYNYTCRDGRIHLQVVNHSFPCYFKGQEIKIQLFASHWLHVGTIICPSCQQLCGQYLEEDFKCKEDSHDWPKTVLDKTYHKDYLRCGSSENCNPLPMWLVATHTMIIFPSFVMFFFLPYPWM